MILDGPPDLAARSLVGTLLVRRELASWEP